MNEKNENGTVVLILNTGHMLLDSIADYHFKESCFKIIETNDIL